MLKIAIAALMLSMPVAMASEKHPECGRPIHITENKEASESISQMFGGLPYTDLTITDKTQVELALVASKGHSEGVTTIDPSQVKTVIITLWGTPENDKGWNTSAFDAKGCYIDSYYGSNSKFIRGQET